MNEPLTPGDDPCPPAEQLRLFASGQLLEPPAERVARHVLQCDACAKETAELDLDETLIKAIRDGGREQPALPTGEQERLERLMRAVSGLHTVQLPSATEKRSTSPVEADVDQVLAELKASLRPPQADDELGRLGGYRVLRLLGVGGMGGVFLAEDTQLRRHVALKVIRPRIASSPGSGERFLREARSVAALRHPHIITIYQIGEDAGVPFLAMEYLAGESLEERLQRTPRLPVLAALRIGRQIAAALAAAHERGVIHRDVKPANVFLANERDVAIGSTGETPQVKLLDFGLARALADDEQQFTRSGVFVGTPAYMAPEQAGGGQVDGRADLFSLGCVLYQMLTETRPFCGDGLIATLAALATHHPPAPSQVCGDVPAQVSDLVMRLLEKPQDNRPASAGEVVRRLQDMETAIAKPAVVPPAPAAASGGVRRWRSRSVIMALVGGALLLGAIVVKLRENPVRETAVEVDARPITTLGDPAKPLVAPFNAQQARVGQEAWAKHLGTTVEQKNSVGMTMVLIPPGEFLMGSTPEQMAVAGKIAEVEKFKADDYRLRGLTEESPQHRVALTKPFWMGSTEVTVGQFKEFVEATSYATEAERYGFGDSSEKTADEKLSPGTKKRSWRTPGYVVSHQSPVSQVTWNDACAFCNWLSEQERWTPCYRPDGAGSWLPTAKSNGYRLPTEAEWEYACRAGTTTQYSFGDDYQELGNCGWYHKNSNNRALPVGLKPANAFGLHDMHGNVGERCWDYHDTAWYEMKSPKDPVGPISGSDHVQRGGTWSASAFFCRSAYRYHNKESDRGSGVGFRCARDAVAPSKPAVVATPGNPPLEPLDNLPAAKPVEQPPPLLAPFDAARARAGQEAWAKHLGTTVEQKNSIGMTMVLIPAGEFLMGNTPDQYALAVKLAELEKIKPDSPDIARMKEEMPQHHVVLSKPFLIDRTEVTIGQFKKFIEATRYVTEAEQYGFGNSDMTKPDDTVTAEMTQMTWRAPGYAVSDDSPVAQVTWNDAVNFCNWLSDHEQLKPWYRKDVDTWILSGAAGGYRLPTEAEWDYACRAGTTTQFWFGDNAADLEQHEWYDKNAGGRARTVGLKSPNPFGLYDMHGNVRECCSDYYNGKWYENSPLNDPVVPVARSSRVIRGGHWAIYASNCRSAYRHRVSPSYRHNHHGFRCARDAVSPSKTAVVATPGTPPLEPLDNLPAAKPAEQPPPLLAPFDAARARAGQEAWAKHLGTTVEQTNSVGMTMVLIPPGEFLMGSTDEQVAAALKLAEEIKADQGMKDRIQKSERPQHRVLITKPFLMSATEVTVSEFRKFVEASKYVTEAEQYGFGNSYDKTLSDQVKEDQRGLTWKSPRYSVTDESPVTQVTWNDACAFCNWLSEQGQRAPCYRPDGSGRWFATATSNGYRMPTEAQWEYACRAGTTTLYSFGDDYQELGEYGWDNENSGNRSRPVGMKPANAFGLHDMHGNLQEWCQDFYDEKWYEKKLPNNPKGPDAGSGRVIRGGVWNSHASYCRSAFRNYHTPSSRSANHGFRCVRAW